MIFRPIKLILNKLLFILSWMGIQPVVFVNNIKGIPRYLRDMREWKRQGGKITHYYPILGDFNDQGGSANGQYFHQDLLIASYIFSKNPKKHIDIASRIDGFVAHVASFRVIEVFDIRPINTNHPNISFKQHDFMNASDELKTDSLSCLHALEHFGLGRYSDPIDVNGFEKGIDNLIHLIDLNGILYLSFPISKKEELHFNAHRVLNPLTLLKFKSVNKYLELINFDCVDDLGDLHKSVDINSIVDKFSHGLGIYTFKKITN